MKGDSVQREEIVGGVVAPSLHHRTHVHMDDMDDPFSRAPSDRHTHHVCLGHRHVVGGVHGDNLFENHSRDDDDVVVVVHCLLCQTPILSLQVEVAHHDDAILHDVLLHNDPLKSPQSCAE